MLPIFVLAFAQFAITLTQAQLCDKRKIGGELLCCKGTNNSCWVRVPSSYESNLPAGLARVCYCDEYCLTTGDCCPDLNRVRDECGGLNCSFKKYLVFNLLIFGFSSKIRF